MAEDFRRLRRRKADASIQVLDCMTQQPIGFIADISEVGMMIAASRRMTPDGLYQCEIRFFNADGVDKCIHVGAHELWSDANPQTGQAEVGFRFIDISPADRSWLRAWVNEPGSRYT
jgi:c-di-GMP-binding flagellar brake protein YcgR